ncbi:DNA integrity scanning protein DisA nucleotide-binding domain protein [Candidatus Alkanophaga liquidiphilum]|nr:c-di-AMP synthetase [Candidatus Alkanophaga liquidiphilum]
MFEEMVRGCRCAEVLATVIELAVRLAREGREGKKVGALFVVGDEENVLKMSKPLILDPLWGHPLEAKDIRDTAVRETVKELAKLDGAFIISDAGHVLSAARYIQANCEGVNLPFGLGSRHMAAASISKETDAVAVVVSKSGIVRVFDDGELICEIMPKTWMGTKTLISGEYEKILKGDIVVFKKAKK